LEPIEITATNGALNRCRALAEAIVHRLGEGERNDFHDVRSLAEFYASLELAAELLQQKKKM
jgi:hypothetical protein